MGFVLMLLGLLFILTALWRPLGYILGVLFILCALIVGEEGRGEESRRERGYRAHTGQGLRAGAGSERSNGEARSL